MFQSLLMIRYPRPPPIFLSHCSQQSFQFAFLHRHDFATLNVMPGKLILLKNPIRILNITKKGGCSSVYFCQGHVCIAKKFNFRLTLQKKTGRNILMKRVGSNKHNEVVNNNFSWLYYTVIANHSKSLTLQHCERSELPLLYVNMFE